MIFHYIIWQSVFIYNDGNRLEPLFEMYAFSGQNSQFGRLAEKLSPPTFSIAFLNFMVQIVEEAWFKIVLSHF